MFEEAVGLVGEVVEQGGVAADARIVAALELWQIGQQGESSVVQVDESNTRHIAQRDRYWYTNDWK